MDGAKSKANYCPEKQKRRFQVLLKGTQMGGGGGPDYIVGTQSNVEQSTFQMPGQSSGLLASGWHPEACPWSEDQHVHLGNSQ